MSRNKKSKHSNQSSEKKDLNIRLGNAEVALPVQNPLENQSDPDTADIITAAPEFEEEIDDGVEFLDEIYGYGEGDNAVHPTGMDLTVPKKDPDETDVKLMNDLAKETAVGHYNFISLAAIIILVIGIALTLMLIRESQRYGEDNIELSFSSFMDGTYAQQLSNKYLGDLKLGQFISKLDKLSSHIYGFSSDDTENLINNNTNDGGSNGSPNIGAVTTSTTSGDNTQPAESTTPPEEASVVTDPSATGSAVTTVPKKTTASGDGDVYTGATKSSTTTSLTTEFTTTKEFSYTTPKTTTTAKKTEPSKSEATSKETTEPTETTPEETSLSSEDTSPSDTSETVPEIE